ncbi:MAG: hypothetical protein HQK97_05545 [Nitrospirae bacterium]|nr:hypothetical protein [Nitrospirota bacterium]
MIRWSRFLRVLPLLLSLLVPTLSHASSGWTWTSTATNAKWYAVASSADGTKLAGVIKGGDIWTYGNGTWTENKVNGDNNSWSTVASNADGSVLIAAVNGGDIWTSSNGVWTANNVNGGKNNWVSVASSSDGTKLFAAASGGDIWAYSKGTWSAMNAAGGGNTWAGVAASADGTKLVAAVNTGDIWTYSNGTWTPNQVNGGSSDWAAVASNSDGSVLVAANSTGIWINSNNFWTLSLSGQTGWSAVASNSDGTRLAAVSYGGDIWTYSNGAWTAGNVFGANDNWNTIASDSTGTKLVAGISAARGSIWVGTYSTTYAKASEWIYSLYTEYYSYFGTLSGTVAAVTTTGGTYYVQWYTNGKALLAWTDGNMYYYNGSSWTWLGVSWNLSVLATATSWINVEYNIYSTYFGTASGGVVTGSDSSGTYYIQYYKNGTALLAYSNGYLYFYGSSGWASLGVKWE